MGIKPKEKENWGVYGNNGQTSWNTFIIRTHKF